MNAYSTSPSRERLAAVLLCLACGANDALAQVSWAFAPGAFTHDPRTGVRVAQYAQHEPVEGLPDPRQTVSRYWRSQTNLRGVDGSTDTIYEVRSFGNTLGGFDAQRERGHDAQLETLDALTPFRFNPYLFFGGTQGFGYGYPGYPASPPGTPVPGPQGAFGYGGYGQGVYGQGACGAWQPPLALPQAGGCEGEGCAPSAPAYAPAPMPYPGQPGTAYPYAPPSGFVAPPLPYFGYGFGGYGHGYLPPWFGYGPGREGYFRGGYPGGVPSHP
jgi:hypothetical protein